MITINGYCPVCEIQGRRVELILNKSDFFECPVYGIQTGLSCRPMALLMHESGDGEFVEPVIFAGPHFHSYNLAPETEDMNPSRSAAEMFFLQDDLIDFIKRNDLLCGDLPVVRIPNLFFKKMINMAIEDHREMDFEISILDGFMKQSVENECITLEDLYAVCLDNKLLNRVSIYRKDKRSSMGIMRYKILITTEEGDISYAADIDEFHNRQKNMKSCINFDH